MSAGLTFLLTVAIVWLATGLVASIVMARRGHRWFTWLMLGSIFGPLVLPLLPIVASVDRSRAPLVIREGAPGPGEVDVAIGIDGSPGALAAAIEAIRLLAPSLRQVSLVNVQDFEAAEEANDPQALHRAAADIEFPPGVDPELVEVHGRPAEALAKFAAERGALLVVGEHGKGFAPVGLGTVTKAIRGKARGPYLVVGGVARLTGEQTAAAERRAQAR